MKILYWNRASTNFQILEVLNFLPLKFGGSTENFRKFHFATWFHRNSSICILLCLCFFLDIFNRTFMSLLWLWLSWVSSEHAFWLGVQWRIQRGFGGSNEPPLEPKLFHFHGEFQGKLVKLHKSNPPSANLNPRSKNPGSAPGVVFKPVKLVEPNILEAWIGLPGCRRWRFLFLCRLLKLIRRGRHRHRLCIISQVRFVGLTFRNAAFEDQTLRHFEHK